MNPSGCQVDFVDPEKGVMHQKICFVSFHPAKVTELAWKDQLLLPLLGAISQY